MGGMSAEGIMFGAGYGTVNAVDALYEGRDPDEVFGNFVQEVGTGMIIGAAIPLVFKGPGALIAKGLQAGKYAFRSVANWAADSKAAKSYYKHVASGAGDLQPGLLGDRTAEGFRRQTKLKENLQNAHRVESALAQDREIIARKGDIVEDTGKLIERVFDMEDEVRLLSSAGHSVQYITGALREIAPGGAGGPSSAVLADLLVNGTKQVMPKTVRGQPMPVPERAQSAGLLDMLEYQIAKIIQDTTVNLDSNVSLQKKIIEIGKKKTAEFVEQTKAGVTAAKVKYSPDQLPHGALPELERMLDDIEHLRKLTGTMVNGFKDSLPRGSQRMGPTSDAGRVKSKPYEIIPEARVPAGPRRGDISRMMDPDNAAHFNVEYNTEVFHRLEMLSNRAHRMTLEGPAQKTPEWDAFRTAIKDQVRDFLESKGTWFIRHEGHIRGLTPWGALAERKAQTNALMTQHQALYDQVKTLFMETDPAFIATQASRIRHSKAKIETWIETLDHANSKTSLEILENFTKRTSELSDHLVRNYHAPSEKLLSHNKYELLRARYNVIAEETAQAHHRFLDHKKFLTEDVKDGLAYGATLQRERNIMYQNENPSLIPYAFGLGIGGTAGGLIFGDDEGFSIGGAAALGVGAAALGGAARFGHDAMLNPGRAMTKLHTWFTAANKYGDFVEEQVRRYFKWVNYSKYTGRAHGLPAEYEYTKKYGKYWMDRGGTGVPLTEGPGRGTGKIGPLSAYDIRATYQGPGDTIRWPRLLVSNEIAQLVSGNMEKKYKGTAEGEPGTRFGAAEYKNAQVITKALSQKEVQDQIIDVALNDLGAVDPNLRAAAETRLRKYLDQTAKAVSDIEQKPLDQFSEAPPPSDMELQRLGEELAVGEYGFSAVLRSLYAGTLTKNEIKTFWAMWPGMAHRVSMMFQQQMLEPDAAKNIPLHIRQMLQYLIDGGGQPQQLVAAMQGIYEKKKKESEEGKPGPAPSAKWVEGRFPAAQLSGSRAIEQRRTS